MTLDDIVELLCEAAMLEKFSAFIEDYQSCCSSD